MENINKFKVFTIVIICTFVFVIAAIYTNTKDVTEDKAGVQNENSAIEDYRIGREMNSVQKFGTFIKG